MEVEALPAAGAAAELGGGALGELADGDLPELRPGGAEPALPPAPAKAVSRRQSLTDITNRDHDADLAPPCGGDPPPPPEDLAPPAMAPGQPANELMPPPELGPPVRRRGNGSLAASRRSFSVTPATQALAWSQRAAAVSASIDFGRRLGAGFGGPRGRPGSGSPSEAGSELGDAAGLGPLAAGKSTERLFHREVVDVHNEIDKLLGGLKSELELWRAEFESLQAFWFSHVVEPGQGEPAQFATLLDFQRALARHIEDVDLDLQQLEERLATVDADREELVELLQDGRREVDRLEQEGARLRREAAASKKAGERAAAQAQQQVNLLSEALADRGRELAEATAKLDELAEGSARLELAASDLRLEKDRGAKKVDQLDRQVAELKATLAEKTELVGQSDLDARRARASLEAKAEECERLSVAAASQAAELALAEEAVAQRNARVSELKRDIQDNRAAFIECKSMNHELQRQNQELEEALARTAAESKALQGHKVTAAAELHGAQKRLTEVADENEALQTEVVHVKEVLSSLNVQLEALKTDRAALAEERDAARAGAEAELAAREAAEAERGREEAARHAAAAEALRNEFEGQLADLRAQHAQDLAEQRLSFEKERDDAADELNRRHQQRLREHSSMAVELLTKQLEEFRDKTQQQ